MDQKQAEKQMQGHLDRLMKDPGQKPEETDLSPFQNELGRVVRKIFDEAERDRSEIEQEWIKDLRQYKGIYDPEVMAKIDPNRSKAYLSITRTKVKTVGARIIDILFPASGARNFAVSPSPVPELNPQLLQSISAQIQQHMGRPPTESEIKKIVFDEARDRAERMQKEIEDQLNEVRYREIIRKVVHGGNIYGTGVLKGPLVKRNKSRRWVNVSPDDWSTIQIESLSPFCENVPIWDIYPDMSVSNIDDASYICQLHVMPRHKFSKLSTRPGFRADAIKAYLKANKDGDSSYRNYDNYLTELSRDGSTKHQPAPRKNKYDVIEFWGYLSTDELAAGGVDVPEDQLGLTVAANVWVVGDVVIKAVISPIEGVNFPYFFYYYEKDETSVFGEGIPRIMRHSQSLFNGGVRAMLDNASNSAGPYVEANTELLAPDEDPTKLYPFRVFLRHGTGVEAQAKAINVYDLPSHTRELLEMVQFFLHTADEITTVPRYMYGDTAQMQQGAQTATGLSMLMGAANITVKDQIKNYDDGVTKPFIKALYYWNMDFSPKPDIKGDFEVKAEGSTALVAKEVLIEQLINWLQFTNNPVDLQLTNRDEALRCAVKAMDLDEYELVKTREQIAFEREQAARSEQEQRQMLLEVERLRAKAGGHVDDSGRTNRPSMENLGHQALQRGEIPQVTTPDGQTL